jgi:hypothetical protein
MPLPPWLTDVLLARALEIVAVMHAPPAVIEDVVFVAVTQIATAVERAEKTIEDRIKNERAATRLVLLGAPLFQRLVLISSDCVASEEGDQELCGQTEARMAARYLQMIVLYTLKRSAKWAGLGIGELVYVYGAASTHRLIEQVTQTIWSEHKASRRDFIKALRKRFGGLRIVTIGRRRYKCFEPAPNQARFVATVETCLDLLTPWDSHHWNAPPRIPGPAIDTDWEELDRCHAFIHPACFAQLAAALHLKPPRQMLALPQLVRCEGSGPPAATDDDLVMASDLTRRASRWRDTMQRIRTRAAEHEQQRERASGDVFEVHVDRVGVACLAGGDDVSIEIRLPKDADLVEVYGDAVGPVLLATYVLDHDENGRHVPSEGRAQLGRAHQLLVSVRVAERRRATDSPVTVCRVKIRRVGRLGLTVPERSDPLDQNRNWTTRRSVVRRTLAIAATILVAALGGWLLWWNVGLRAELAQLRVAYANLPREPIQGGQVKEAPPPAPVETATLLLPDSFRPRGKANHAEIPVISIRRDASDVILDLQLPPGKQWPSYRCSLEQARGTLVTRFAPLAATPRGAREQIVTVHVDPGWFTSGTYLISLDGLTTTGRPTSIADYTFAIRKPPTARP